MAIDFGFLRRVEGFESEGYVPQDDQGVIENSGVTIGSGIDLGQWTRKQLEDMGVSSAVLDKIEPYLGKKKDKALQLLQQQPLSLDTQEAEELTRTVKKGYADKVKRWYNKNNSANNDWSDLTDRQQTTITSVAFQYGVGSKNTPNFNKQVLNNDWRGVVNELKNFGDRYDTRRHMELQYMVGADVDGVIGPQTEEATERYLTVQETMTPDAPQPTYPQLDSLGFTENLMAMLQESLKSSQRASQTPSRSRIEEGEAKLERTANEAQLEATAQEAEEEALSTESVEFTPFEQSLIDDATAEFDSEPSAAEQLDVEFTPFEQQLIEYASGTEETEAPVYARKEEGDEESDRIRELF